MSSELVEVIERDLREVVEAEIRKFLDRYEDCEKVDNIVISEHMFVTKYDVVIHSLPCDIYKNFVITHGGVYEIGELKCYVTYEDEEEEKDMGYIVVAQLPDRCFINSFVFNDAVYKVAKRIVEEAEAEE